MKLLKTSPGIAPLVIVAIIAVVAIGGVTAFVDMRDDDGQAKAPLQDSVATARGLIAEVEIKLDEIEGSLDDGDDQNDDELVDDVEDVDEKLADAGDEVEKARSEKKNVDELIQRLQANFNRRQAVLERVLAQVPPQARDAIVQAMNNREQSFMALIARLQGEDQRGGGTPDDDEQMKEQKDDPRDMNQGEGNDDRIDDDDEDDDSDDDERDDRERED